MALADWLAALYARHTRELSRPELLKAVRALSARYVEQRASLPTRSPLDSAGKRAAFAVFYAPLHFLTTQLIVRAIGAAGRPLDRIVDLGCGTGAASAAWGLEAAGEPVVTGVDTSGWALGEARWNWQQLGVRGQTRRGDLVDAAAGAHGLDRGRTGIIAGWAVNELPAGSRERLLASLLDAANRGAAVLVIEPLARATAPWWPDWTSVFENAGGLANDWKFDAALAEPLASLDRDAGFRREHLAARSLFLPSGG